MKELYKNLNELNSDGIELSQKIINAIEPIIHDSIYQNFDEYQLTVLINSITNQSIHKSLNSLENEYNSSNDLYERFSKIVSYDRTEEKPGKVLGQLGDNLILRFEENFIPKFPYQLMKKNGEKVWTVYIYQRM